MGPLSTSSGDLPYQHAVTLLFVYLKWTFSYWDRKGFPSTGVSIPFGALESVTKGKRSFGLAIHDLYQSTREPVVGMYLTVRPALLVRDAQLAHDVLVKDFASFHDRGVYVDEKNDPMSANLFAMEGASWRALRNKLTPSFTSGKLKAMFETSNSVGDKLIANIKAQLPETGIKELDIKSLTSTFADPNNEFFAISKKLNRNTFQDIVRGATSFLYPGLEKFFVKIGWKQEAFERMRELSNRTVDLREKNNLVRRDLLQLLLQLRNQGKINTDDSVWSAESTKNGVKSMSKDLVAGQLLLFYAAGFETTASTTSFTLYELTQNPEVMAKAKEDVRSAIEKNGGTLNYDAISDMKYLEACVLGLHHDEDNFPDPLSYQPERYLEDNKNYNQAAYLPFGEGPRMCIGARMGKVNVKIAIAKVLSNFDLEICKEKREIEFGIHGVTLMPKNGIPIRFSLKNYWDRKGFPTTGVRVPFGAMESVTKGKRSFGMAIYDMYHSTKEPVVGIYLTLRPALLIRDAQLAHDVLVKDFASFHDRGVYVDEKNDPMSASLFAMEGASWRALRTKLTPSFTSGKLKAMFETSDSVGDKLIASMKAQLSETGSKELELKRLMATLEKFFVRIGWKQEANERMRELSNRTVDLREHNNIVRKDMLQLLLQLRNQGKG
ncbi:hypothetical protein M5D96_002523 [Drosophila gunungcola]|uniref:Cytochrome P450 6d5 n=1 Tax=Drosophila gunungcola TaxID=103775 RepID=A0A9P9Z062_9MUSC|nr:hypothetical protein M5D96_002523 [Drosophila gunungcola]